MADALNSRDAEKIRDGFRTEVYNSRGAHTIDPTGKPERKLAKKYKQQADELENAGYQRFAVTLRQLAVSYDSEAEHIIAEHIFWTRPELVQFGKSFVYSMLRPLPKMAVGKCDTMLAFKQIDF